MLKPKDKAGAATVVVVAGVAAVPIAEGDANVDFAIVEVLKRDPVVGIVLGVVAAT